MLGSDKHYKVNKSDLLNVLRANRTKHTSAFEEANKAYRAAAIDALKAKLAQVTEGKAFDLHRWPGVMQPESHVAEYDRVIGLLEFTTETVLEITPTDYQQYVLDEWAWKSAFDTTVGHYNNKEQ